MRRTTRPLAVTVLCLAGVAIAMPGLAAAAAPASAPTARQPDDEYFRLLETALEGITIPGYTRGSIDDRDANAECVFRHPSGRVHPVGIRWNEPGWLDETWLGEPETVIVRDSIGLGDRSALIRGERGGLSMCGAFVVTGEIIISVGFANPRGPFTEEDQQRTLDLIEQMYENLRVAHGFDPSPDRPEPAPRGNDRPPPGRDEPVAPAGGLGDSSRDQLNQNRMSRLYQALLDADAPTRGMPDPLRRDPEPPGPGRCPLARPDHVGPGHRRAEPRGRDDAPGLDLARRSGRDQRPAPRRRVAGPQWHGRGHDAAGRSRVARAV